MDKRIALIVFGIAMLSASALTRAQTVPRAFPRDGAKLVLENDVVAIWDVSWAKNSSPMLQTRFDQVTVGLADGVLKVTRPDSSWSVEQLRPGSVQFQSKGSVFAVQNAGEGTARALVAEIKSYAPPAMAPDVAAGLKDARAKGLPGQFPREGAVKVFENDRLTLWDNVWPLNRGLGPMHAHYRTAIGLFFQPGVLAPKTTRAIGEVVYSQPRIPPHQEQALEGPPRAIFIELK